MSFSKHVRHCRKCITLSRPLTDSAANRDAGGTSTVLPKLPSSVPLNFVNKSKMSMHSKMKLLSQLKEFFNKSNYDKNLQFIMNKEWLYFLQKLTYAQIETIRKYSFSDDTKEVELKRTEKSLTISNKNVPANRTSEEKAVTHEVVKQNVQHSNTEIKDPYSYLPDVINNLIPKLSGKKESPLPAVQKWKNKPYNNVTKINIISRTKHIINSITTAESNASKWRRIEDLLKHIDQFPEAKHYAVKADAIKILLRARKSTKDEQIRGTIREALAVLGYIEPLPGRGIRILSIDGGGIRGVIVIEMLKQLERLTGQKVYEMFDYICGVSTGAILSSVLALKAEDEQGGHKRKSLDEISESYKQLSSKIFTQSTLRGTSKMLWSHGYYDTALWEQMLQENLGNKDLIKTVRDPTSPKFSVISAVVNQERIMAYVFRNYAIPIGIESQYEGSYKHKVWEAVRASAAAPSYFDEFKCGDYLHQDGGIMVNNPCAVAIHEAKQLWPNSSIQCVVSFGTGRFPCNPKSCTEDKKETLTSSWKDKFYHILGSATDTEVVHTMLNDLLPDHVYYRFNPYLTEMLSMVEIRPEKISQLEQDAAMYIRKNEIKFQKAARMLMQPKTPIQKIVDWIKLQKDTIGI